VYVWDFIHTWLALTSAKYPQKIKDKSIKPLIGHSILPAVFKGVPFHQEKDREVLFFYKGTKATAYIKGKWKIVSKFNGFSKTTWELYQLDDDPTEIKNLAKTQSAKVKEMESSLMAYVEKHGTVKDFEGYLRINKKK